MCGIVKFDGDLQIDGNIDADIRCERLFVSETSSIKGVVTAGMVEVFGKLQGEVFANLIILRPTAHVEAELNYRALELDPGSYFEGRSRCLPDPIAASPSYNFSNLPPCTSLVAGDARPPIDIDMQGGQFGTKASSMGALQDT